mmetsp:Transcript_36750/g.105085  ORF Transcript_36750/g.105085 Transcript_36750/m.105085 type:complete len:204 (-) Transcript_36750:1436-2047(-)
MLAQLAATRAALGRASQGCRFWLGVSLSCVQSNSRAGQWRGRSGTVVAPMRAEEAFRTSSSFLSGGGKRSSVGTAGISPRGCAPQRCPESFWQMSPGLSVCIASLISALMPRVRWYMRSVWKFPVKSSAKIQTCGFAFRHCARMCWLTWSGVECALSRRIAWKICAMDTAYRVMWSHRKGASAGPWPNRSFTQSPQAQRCRRR